MSANNVSIINSTRNIVSRQRNNLTSLRQIAISHSRSTLQFQHRSLEHYTSLVRVARPDSILKRGFALVKSGDKIVTNADHVEVGTQLDIILSEVF
ncbi:MAG: exodeoxyribonuclease VII large subunit [Bacteroidota bacterium]